MKNQDKNWIVVRGIYVIIFLLTLMLICFQLGQWYKARKEQPQICSFAQCTQYIWQCEKVNYNGYDGVHKHVKKAR